MVAYSVPGMKRDDADKLVALLQDRLPLMVSHLGWRS
jgi:hypothetical protein